VGGDAGEVNAPGAVLDEHQGVQALERDGVEVQEVGGYEAVGLGGEKPVPRRAGALRCGVHARRDAPLCTHGTSGTFEPMTQMPIESIRDVRAHLAEVVERADRDDQPTVITRRGKQVAAVVSIDTLRKYQQWEEREINRIIDERMANRSAGIPIEDVMKETLARSE
jgi:prevent-host-death family protein